MGPYKKMPESYFNFPHDETDSFLYHEMYPPDYSYWKKMSLWNIDEAVHLIHGVRPEFYENLSDSKSIDNAEAEIKRTKKILERDILANKISRERRRYVKPEDVVNWALGHEIKVPRELLSFFENSKKDIHKSLDTAQKPPYLDYEHNYYAEELAIAIKTWMALFENKEYISKKEKIKNPQFRGDIQKHIKNHYGEKSDRALDRITTVINPKKKGGAQSTN